MTKKTSKDSDNRDSLSLNNSLRVIFGDKPIRAIYGKIFGGLMSESSGSVSSDLISPEEEEEEQEEEEPLEISLVIRISKSNCSLTEVRIVK